MYRSGSKAALSEKTVSIQGGIRITGNAVVAKGKAARACNSLLEYQIDIASLVMDKA